MKASFSAAALTVLLCAGCSQPTSPTSQLDSTGLESGAQASVSHEVPFKGRFEGSQTLTPQQPPFGFVNGSATGNATHLGRFTVAFPHTVNFATRTGVGTFTFEAANGDSLTADFTGLAQGGPVVSIEERATITGGTGRFAGAKGSFVVQRSFDPASGVTEGSFEGTISRP
jgi:hypothetical protein